MSQTTTPAPARGATPPAPSGAWSPGRAGPSPSGPAWRPGTAPVTASPLRQARSRLAAAVRSSTAGTPGRLRIFAALAILVSIAFGLAAAQAFRAESEALDRGAANAQQLVRVEGINTALVRADAGATDAFLVGGIEPLRDRTQYLTSLDQAATLIAEAARAQPADGKALGVLNEDVVTYAGMVEQARANNRQGWPIGATYLAEASQSLRTGAVPVLQALVTANQARTLAEFDSSARASLWVVVFGVLALAALIGIMVWLARRTHRLVNMPLATASLVILVTGVLAMLTLSSLSTHVRQVRRQSYAVAQAAADARIAAFDAKSSESLTLIQRGSGATDKTWKSYAATAAQQARLVDTLRGHGSNLLGAWTPYAQAHAKIRALDDNGGWGQAVALSAKSTSPGSSYATFQAFDTASASALNAASDDTTTRLSAYGWLPLLGVLALLVGLLAAACAWSGIAVRLEEYR